MDVEIDLGFGIFTLQRVRLLGVDSPETFRPSCDAERDHGIRAKEFVEKQVTNGKKCILTTDRDRKCKYGRYLGILFTEGSDISINDLLHQQGLCKLSSYTV
jgi:micrococcal nuclease